tara:strand:+ start:117 stop:254 length:138 start_codon:yes stop_codon:yes gene_type:complete
MVHQEFQALISLLQADPLESSVDPVMNSFAMAMASGTAGEQQGDK